MQSDRARPGLRASLLRAVYGVSFAVMGLIAVAASAQAQDVDLSELSFDELLDVDVISVGVLGTHTHLKGEWMLGYGYMQMGMGQLRTGSQPIGAQDVLQDFMVTPTAMSMRMHMVHLMYAPSDAITIMAMAPYLNMSMDHQTRMGMTFTAESQAIGDVSLEAFYTLFGNVKRDAYHASAWGTHRVILKGGVSLPTGSIEARDDLPSGPDQRLPYPMQIGAGTFTLLPGLAYLGESGAWAWGGELDTRIQIGTNRNGYQLGNAVHLSASGSRGLTNQLSFVAGVDGGVWGDIEGSDPTLMPGMVPTADPQLRGGKRVDLSVGLNFYVPHGGVNKGQRLTVTTIVPLFESLDGPQLGNDWTISLGWSWTLAG